jgi:hypothetical protein
MKELQLGEGTWQQGPSMDSAGAQHCCCLLTWVLQNHISEWFASVQPELVLTCRLLIISRLLALQVPHRAGAGHRDQAHSSPD